MSLVVGLTGGLASGKTTVAEMLRAKGAHVLYADRVGHELMEPGNSEHHEIVRRFGELVVNPDKTINRSKLAEMAFGTGRIEELNRIIHPAVAARLENWIAERTEFDARAILVFEAALILEAGLGKYFDKLIVVTSRAEQKLERFASRAGKANDPMDQQTTARQAERRIGAQLSEDEKIAAADYIIDNSGTLTETERQVTKIFKELQQLARGKQPAVSL